MVIGAIAGMLGIVTWVSTWAEEDQRRVHQHLQTKKQKNCEHNEKEFCTHLPIVSIDTGGQTIHIGRVGKGQYSYQKSSEIVGQVEVIDNIMSYNHLKDEEVFKTKAKIHYRGNTSLKFDKKSYKIEFIQEDLTKNDQEDLLGMGNNSEWVLNGPFLDKTLIRNYMCMNIAGEIMKDTPDVRFCEVFIDGQYRGVYVAMENVTRSPERVNITPYKEGDTFTSYIIRADRKRMVQEELNNFTHYANRMHKNTAIEIIYPEAVKNHPDLKQYIEEDFSKFEKALYSLDYDDRDYGYRKYIDIESFVDYFIINEFFKSSDAGIFSTYFYKDVRGKLHIGPVWDFNNAADNFIAAKVGTHGMEMVNRSWYFMLMKDEEFVERVIERYDELRQGWLNEELLLQYIDDTVSFLGDAIIRNNQVWGYSFNPENLNVDNRLMPIERNITSYEEGINQLKNFIIRRGKWLDENIHTLRQYAHESKVKKFNY